MPSIERLHSLDQVKILSDPRRLKILKALMIAPSTLTRLGEALGEHPAWIRHHLKLLEQADLVELREVRISGGYVEKYYQSRSNAFLLQELLLPEIPGKRTIVLSGSHDLALEMLSRLGGDDLYIFTNPIGSLDGLVALREGLCNATGCHLYDTPSGDYNTPYVRHFFPDKKMVILTLAHREQGLIVRTGNPQDIRNLEDLIRPGLGFINRNRGSGTRLWLDGQLMRMGISTGDIQGYKDEVSTHTAVATAIQQGHADAGLGIHAVAGAYNLGFIPLFQERYDLVVPEEQYEQKQLAPMFDAFFSAGFRHQVESLVGYDVSHLGDQIIL